ncbi:MAG: alpha-amylase family glycosyl hydrolase [Bacteroidota bacterium]
MRALLSVSLAGLALSGCIEPASGPSVNPLDPEADLSVAVADTPPAWAAEAVWYQIFPERFRNGDPANDPTPASMEGSWPTVGEDSLREAGWQVSAWTSDWYAQADWERKLRDGDFYFTAQARRYGGDLQGVLDALPYLDSLGVTALYLNPVNDSPSLHKYDARAFRHVDPHFGPDPEGDRAMIAVEDPEDPETWSTTAADALLLDLLEAAHARDMRVVLDYSWNHTGTQFWAFQDVLENGPDSPYADWYRIDAWDDPATEADEFAYTGWAGVATLPEFRKTDLTGDPEAGVPLDGDLAPGPKGHAFAVTLRWLDPDGDGDPSDGVDGFRLDVAEQVPLGFWRDYRRFVKTVNPEAVLIGEIWWQDWPETMMNPAPYLGDVFDSVMHYRPFRPLRQLLDPAGPQISAVDAASELEAVYADVPPEHLPALMSMSGSHDTPRLATTLQNAGVPYKNEETPRNRPGYDVSRPGPEAWRSVALFRLLQATLPGAPHVYYGDEVGMWGADDPDDRKPMLWPELTYAPEVALPDGTTRPPDPVRIDRDVLGATRRALALRRAHLDLWTRGTLEWDAFGDVLRFTRQTDSEAATVVVNLADRPQRVGVPVDGTTIPFTVGPLPEANGPTYTMAPRTGAVFLIDPEREL